MNKYILLLVFLINCKTTAVTFEPCLPKPDECVKDYAVLEKLRFYRDYFWSISVDCKEDKCQAEDLLFAQTQELIEAAIDKTKKCKIIQVNLQDQNPQVYFYPLRQLPESSRGLLAYKKSFRTYSGRK